MAGNFSVIHLRRIRGPCKTNGSATDWGDCLPYSWLVGENAFTGPLLRWGCHGIRVKASRLSLWLPPSRKSRGHPRLDAWAWPQGPPPAGPGRTHKREKRGRVFSEMERAYNRRPTRPLPRGNACCRARSSHPVFQEKLRIWPFKRWQLF